MQMQSILMRTQLGVGRGPCNTFQYYLYFHTSPQGLGQQIMAVQHLIYECEIKKIYRKVLRGHPREPRQETTFAFPSFFNLFSILMCSTIFSCQDRNFIYSKKSLQKFLPSFAVEKIGKFTFHQKKKIQKQKKIKKNLLLSPGFL